VAGEEFAAVQKHVRRLPSINIHAIALAVAPFDGLAERRRDQLDEKRLASAPRRTDGALAPMSADFLAVFAVL
jgi:hypothetical protein